MTHLKISRHEWVKWPTKCVDFIACVPWQLLKSAQAVNQRCFIFPPSRELPMIGVKCLEIVIGFISPHPMKHQPL